MEGKKYIKIGRVYRQRKWDSIVVPEIRINGIWLEELGFKVGDELEIIFSSDRLLIISIDKYE